MWKKISKIIAMFIVLLILIFIIVKLYGKYKLNDNFSNEEINNLEYNPRYVFSSLINNDLHLYFKDREILIDKLNYCIKIGKNKKELENGYLDINIVFNANSIDIYMNKLIKSDFSNEYICDEYLDELVKFILAMLKLESDENLKESIVYEYTNFRDKMYLNNDFEWEKYEKYIQISEYNVLLCVEENMLKLDIKR